MKPYNQRLSITRGRRTMLLALLLFVGIQGANGQKQSNPLYKASGQEKTSPLFETDRAAEQGHDADSDDDNLLRVEGTVGAHTESTLTLAMRAQTDGNDLVLRKRPGRAAYADITLKKNTTAAQAEAQDYNSSRSNNSSRSTTTGGSNAATQAAPAQDYNSSRSNKSSRSSSTGSSNETAQAAPATDHNTTRSNRSTVRSTDGALEHTDDWIAVRAIAPGEPGNGLQVVLIALEEQSGDLHIPTDVHSGKLTGVRIHRPFNTAKPVDAATPYSYSASVGENGAFVFEGVAPGAYQVRVLVGGGHEFRGHVTVLK